MRLLVVLFFISLLGCKKGPPLPPLPPNVKCKPTWEQRTLADWYKRECRKFADRTETCDQMGRTTVLVEFQPDGCREFKSYIDNQAALIQGYAPEHRYLFVSASHDALTRILFDHGRYQGAACRIFYFDDSIKPDRKAPNEDQWFVELCKDISPSAESECRGQLTDKRLYTP